MTGVSQYIKGCPEFGLPALKPDLLTIAVEPQEQMLLTEAKGGKKRGEQGPHKVSFLNPCRAVIFVVYGTEDELIEDPRHGCWNHSRNYRLGLC